MKPIYIIGEIHERPTKAFTSIKKLKDYVEKYTKTRTEWIKDYSIDDVIKRLENSPLDENYGDHHRIQYHAQSGADITLAIYRTIMR